MTDPLHRRIRRLVQAWIDPSSRPMRRFLKDVPPRPVPPLGEVPISTIPHVVPSALADSQTVPPLVFQTWKSRSEIPANYRYWRETFVRLNPEAQILLWDDDDNRAFITRRFPWFMPIYDSYPQEIFRADAVRFFFLFEYGGLYADMDSECLRPFGFGQKRDAVLLARMGRDTAFEHSIPNAIMASRPRQTFWLLAITLLIEEAKANPDEASRRRLGPEWMTGPILLKRTYDIFVRHDEDGIRQRIADVFDLLDEEQRRSTDHNPVTLLDRRRWYGLDWTDVIHKRVLNRLNETQRLLSPTEARALLPDAEIVTYWSHSW